MIGMKQVINKPVSMDTLKLVVNKFYFDKEWNASDNTHHRPSTLFQITLA